jgi:cytochrome c oxidase cbb3-type subunit IV
MYKEILQSITGIELFPVISLVLFVIVFTAVLISVSRMDRARADGLAALPLDDPATLPPPENPR